MNRQKRLHDMEPVTLPAGRTKKLCRCGRWFTLPSCHAIRHKSCTAECLRHTRDMRKQQRARPCQECGKEFSPRTTQIRDGIGRFCSRSCSSLAFCRTETRKERDKKSGETYKKSLAAGKFTMASGPAHPQWTGGAAVARRRQVTSGKGKARSARYRRANPHRVAEWAQKRSGKKTGRLPRGTVSLLFRRQRERCAFCASSIKGGYHVDHVMPMHLGGLHEPNNLQLLCPSCNVRKWALHPVEFAQRNGRLL